MSLIDDELSIVFSIGNWLSLIDIQSGRVWLCSAIENQSFVWFGFFDWKFSFNFVLLTSPWDQHTVECRKRKYRPVTD